MAEKSPAFGRKAALWALAIVVGVLFIAWFDGGEEAIHTISKPVEVPAFADEEGAQ